MIKKLRLKFIAVNMILVGIMLTVIFGLVFHFTRRNLEMDNIRMMQALADQPVQPDLPAKPAQKFENIRLPYFIIFEGMKGELLTENSSSYDLGDEDFLKKVVGEALSSEKEYDVITEYNLRFYRMNQRGRQKLVFSDISSELAMKKAMAEICLAIGILSFFAFLGISILLSKWAVRPVEQAWDRQKQFVADASHELKTPLSVILTNSELAGSDDYSGDEKMQFIRNIHTMSEHMKILVEQMLELSRTDRGVSSAAYQAVNLSSVITNTSLTFEAALFENGHTLSCSVIPDITVSGNEQQLVQVLEILLDNAGKYAAENGDIVISLEMQGSRHCRLTVGNEGEPIPEEELKNLFKRFYRMDPSRKRDGSFGLGLSIAENIILAHKGRIWAESSGGYNRFCIVLPAK